MDWTKLFNQVAAGSIRPEDAARMAEGHSDLGFTHLDFDRPRRCGMSEVIFCQGKTTQQVVAIMQSLGGAGQSVLATRASREQMDAAQSVFQSLEIHELARCMILPGSEKREPVGLVAIASAGTADLPVAEEAAVTATWMGARVEKVYDAGVAGLHRVVKHLPLLREAHAVVVVAGMEGALPSVLGGLIDRPIIAVPTSIGYGMSLGGVAALLSMLNACAPGITVVNVDNGFGAGVAAARINRLICGGTAKP